MAFDLDDEEYAATRKLNNVDDIDVVSIGEYVRTDRGFIYKYTKELDKDIQAQDFIFYNQGKTTKHSKYIIDIIEEGDYVNGYEVTNIYIPNDKWEPIQIEIDSSCINYFTQEEINSIVTHEQFNSIMYKVEE